MILHGCVFACLNFSKNVVAGTPVDSFPVARREPAFRLLFNRPTHRAYWLWMDRDPPLGETGAEMEVRRQDAGTQGQEQKQEK